MLRSTVSKVMWVGRATVFLVGLSVILAMVLGLASAAFSATGGNFILGQSNSANAPTTLVGKIVDTTKSVLVLKNPNGGSTLQLQVNPGQAPFTVNSVAGTATNLDADRLDGQGSNSFLGANAKAADSDKLDGKDISELPETVVQMRAISGDVTGKTADFQTLRFITNLGSSAKTDAPNYACWHHDRADTGLTR